MRKILFTICIVTLFSTLMFTNNLLAQTTLETENSPQITRSSRLFDTIEFKSPQIVKGCCKTSITFRVRADKARNVYLDGDFLSTSLRPIKMNRAENGVWEYTYIDTLKMHGLFTYIFYVDSLRFLDPSNINIIRNDTRYYNYFTLNEPILNLNQTPDVEQSKRGNVLHTWYYSKSLNMNRRVAIYLPYDYFLNATSSNPVKYKTLYLIHGMGGDEDSWLRFGRAEQILNNLIENKLIEPLIVVMPNANIDVDAAPGESAIGYNVPDPYLPHTMDGKFEHIFEEIVNFIDSNFSTQNSKSGRYIAGYSMGGLNSFLISLLYPNMFSAVGLFSPAVGYGTSTVEGFANFEKNFSTLVERDFSLYYMKIGREDFLLQSFDALKERIEKKIAEDKKNRDKYQYICTYSDGGHIWTNWREYLVEFLQAIENQQQYQKQNQQQNQK